MKRLAQSLLLCAALLAPVTRGFAAIDAAAPLLKQATAAAAAQKWDEAIGLDEQVIEQHPESIIRWEDAETGIAQALAQKGDLPGALQAAHLCLDGAPTPQAFDAAVTLAAGIMSAQDKNVTRANQFIAFAQQGTGTNPMDAVGYPAQPAREKALAALRLQAGEDAAASRVRAFTYLFTGKPKDALGQFAEAFRRSDNNTDIQHAALDLVNIGLRNMHGHRVGLDSALQFVIYGPNGPDGKKGTPDDIADPFATYLTIPPPGQGGLSGVGADTLAPLQKVYDATRLYAGDPLLIEDFRRSAILALQRSTSALDGWGAPGQSDWYLDLVLGRNGLPRASSNTDSLLLIGAQLAARGRDYHLGAIDPVWATVDANFAANNLTTDKGIENLRKQFTALRANLAKTTFPQVALHPLTDPASF